MIGKTISHYKILEKLGEGGMGVVYKAQDIKLDRLLALKFLPSQLVASEAEKARFLQEAKAASALNHPNVCTIYDIKEEGEQQFIVMEYVDGVTLRKKFESKPLSLNDAITYAIQIGEALKEAHAQGIVHRDVKSDNIMINSKNQVKIMDFGLAKLKGSLKLTKTSSTVGTLAYMSPEQIKGEEVDARSDIFSFGIVLFEMLTGRTPFSGEHEAAMMYSIVNEDPTPIQKYLQDAPAELQHVLNQALEKNPEERYQAVSEMVRELRLIQKHTTKVYHTMTPAKMPEADAVTDFHILGKKAPRRGIFLGIGIAAVVVACVVLYFLFLSPRKPIDSLAVLPFVNVGGDPNTEYLSYGIARTLTDNLSQLANLKVKSQVAVSRYKKKDQYPLEIGKELNVYAVLTGSVELRDQSIIVTVELSDVNEGNQLWGHTYTKSLSDIYLIQEEISKDVTENLKIRVSGAEERKLTKRYTENAEAYQDYLKGMYFRFIETNESLEKAVSYFQQAIEKEPNHALAYAGLAETYFLQEFSVPYPDIHKASALAEKAFKLDPTTPEINITLGIIREFHDLDWKGAEQLFRRAIELNPNHWNAHRELGELFWRTGRFEVAEKEALRSIELEPLSALPYSLLGSIYSSMGKHQMAVDQLEKGAEIDSGFVAEHLGLEYLILGRYEQARAEFERVKSPYISCYYAAVGKKGDALKEIQTTRYQLKEPDRSFYLAHLYSYIGDKGQAMDQLENLVRINPNYFINLRVYSFFDNLHSEPRYVALMKKVGLEK
jgi:TolB-like protein/Flp pilus assembly protein TadD/predicted Ser/Thr protein kinase